MEVPFSNVDKIRQEAENDQICQKIENGWPKNQKMVDKMVVPYFKVKNDLTILNNVILKGNQILVPSSLRRTILNAMHEGHMGIQRCQSLARQTVYWPNMYNDVSNVVNNCEICLKYRNSNSRSEIMPHEFNSIPWFKLGSDIFEFKGQQYLMVIGYSSAHVIIKLKSIYARNGIPQIFISDNGPPYKSREFRNFCFYGS